MKLTRTIAEHVSEVFEGGNWTEVDLKNVLADVTFAEAVTITKASPNSIASIVYHLNFYNEIILNRIYGEYYKINQRNGFDMPALVKEEDWNNLRDSVFNSAKKLSDAVKSFNEQDLFESIHGSQQTAYKNFHGATEHVYYHLGQIFILKTLLRNANSYE